MLKINNLSAKIDNKSILQDFKLEINPGEVTSPGLISNLKSCKIDLLSILALRLLIFNITQHFLPS